MEKIDLKKKYSDCYSIRKNKIEIIRVPTFNYLMINGSGNPNTSIDYQNAIEALFSLAYAIKFKIKKGNKQIDYGVMPLEGLWWTDNMDDFSIDNKDIWNWTACIMQPDFVDTNLIEECINEVQKKKDLPALSKIRFDKMEDSLSAQILHLGPYADETPTIEKLHNFIEENGYTFNGKHREIYLNDSRRTAPEKLKTIIRQPIRKI